MTRRIFRQPSFWMGGIVALVFGVLQALPYWQALPDRGTLVSAARGCAAQAVIPGAVPPSVLDQLNGWLWRMGGPEALSWAKWILVLAGWTLATLVVLTGVAWILRLLPERWVRVMIMVVLAVLLAAACVNPVRHFLKRQTHTHNIDLIAARKLVQQAESAGAGKIFTNASAISDFLLFAPGISLEAAEDAPLALNVPAWRQALREKGWTAVVLAGPVAEYRPLLEHLATAPDWRLVALDNQGFIFQRGTGRPATFSPEDVELATPLDTAIYLAQCSEKLDALRKSVDARSCITRALELAPKDVTVLVHAANFYAARKRWQEAIVCCNRALKEEPNATAPKLVKALALMETGEPDKAHPLVEEVLMQTPEDRYTLFLFARICRARYDYAAEAETLEKLVRLATRTGESPVDYQIYLGQAYARLGQAQPALANYRAALASNRLNPEARAEIKAAIRTIEENQNRN